MTVRVRRLEARDKTAWLALFKDYIAFYKATVADEVVSSVWTRLMTGATDVHVAFVAVDAGDAPIGLAHILFHPSTWSPAHDCYLEDLYVTPLARGLGAGRRLIEAVYAAADQKGCRRTYWVTEEDNHRARGLYDRIATKSVFVQYRR